MRSFLKRLISQDWFCVVLLWGGAGIGGVGGYYIAALVAPFILIVIFALTGFYLNRFAFGTCESYLFIGVWVVVAIVLYPLKPAASVAAMGVVTGCISIFAAMDWMAKPNQFELKRQADSQQRH